MVRLVAMLLFGEDAVGGVVGLLGGSVGVVMMCLVVGAVPIGRAVRVEPASLLRE